jgi:hypothetical protein
VKLSLVDWSWDSSTSRTEDTKVTESLLHDTHRDRVINETMRASLQELQHGSSTMGGAALSAGGAASGGSYGGAVGASGAIGSTYSTSSGSRDLAAQNVQNLSDTFAQKSSSLRELTSTVVVQAHEAQREAIETRTFTNYNHSHTLTILYYEILRHFRVDTEWVGRRPVVLLPGASVSFDPDAILESTICTQRPLLQAALLDPSLAPAFDALEKLQISRENYKLHGIIAGNVAKPTAASDFLFTLFELLIKTSDGLRDKSSAKVVGFVRKFDGRAVPLNFLYEGPHSHEEYQGNDNGPQNLNSGAIFDDTSWAGIYVQPENPVRWGDIAGFEFEKWGNDEWRIDRIGITAFNKDLQIPLVPFDTDTDMYFRDDEPSAFSLTFIKRPDPDPPTPGPVPTPEQALTSEETRLVTRLKEHLKAEIEHYARILRLGRNPNKIAVEFEKQPWDAGTSVLDHVEPYPLEVFGDFVAYPLIDAVDPAGAPDAPPAQELISFPVRGVFAEGKLGHCNLSEEIDETRFWRWEEHTIPIQAPDIAAATPVTPTPLPVNVSPTPLPAGLVNIVNPSPAPDPTGLAAALTAITTANAFRDMSGQTQLTDLLKKLSDNSVAIAQVARSTLASGGGTAGGGTGAAGTGGGAPSSSGGKSPAGSSTAAGGSTGGSGVTRAANPAPQSVAEVNDLAAGIRRQLPPDQANGLVGDLYQNVVDRTAADAGADAAATTPRVTISAATDSQIVQAGNVVFFNAIDVDNYFRDVTGQTFSAWFAGTLANRGSWAGLSMATDAATLARFVQTWDAFPPIVGSDHGDGTPGTTLVEFAALMAVFIHETGGNLLFRGAERIGGPGHSGLSYPFDTFVIHRPGEDPFTKGSYNTGNGNHTAYTNFHDPKYLAAFGALQPTTQSVRDLEAWKGVVWPASVPTAPDAGTAFLQESDFYKFRGRGAIQSTGRVAYLPIVTFVRAYTGNDVMITAVRNRWATFATALGAQGVNVTTDDDFATVSTNADWDSLFTSVTIQAAAISGHNGLAGKHYLPLSSTPATLKGTARGSVFYLAKGIAGKNDDYATHVRNRVVDFIGTLWAVLTPTPPAGAGGADGGVINL